MDDEHVCLQIPQSLAQCHLEKYGKIEVACNDQGVFIVGNGPGLRSHARVLLVLSQAEQPFSSETPPAFHIPSHWDLEGKRKHVLLNDRWLERHLEENAREAFSFDLTLIRFDQLPYIRDFELEDEVPEP